MTIFYCFRFETPQTGGSGPIFTSHTNKVGQLYTQALGSLSVASYDSQCYGGGIRTCLHAGTATNSMSKSKSVLLYHWKFTANQFVLASSPLRPTTRDFFRLNFCGHSPYVTSSLTRGWVCHLQLLLVLASAVILRSESHGNHDHVSLSRLPQLGGPGPRLYIPQEQGDPVTPQALGSLFVVTYDTQGYGGGIRTRLHTENCSLSRRLSLMLRPTVSRPVYLGIKHPSQAYDKILITLRQLRVCLYGTLSLTRGWVSRL
jgi:hypothetical protein